MIPRRPEDGPFHVRLKCQPNTPDEAVALFLANNRMHECKPYQAVITAECCIRRRRLAFCAPRQGFHHSSRMTWRSDVFMQVEKCVKCQDYARPVPKATPPKYGACACGCGRVGRLVGRGMSSSCYQKYRKGVNG